MKALLLLVPLVLLADNAHAERVVVNYPLFQGRPILAVTPSHDSPMGLMVDANAHATCRLLGYPRAAFRPRSDHDNGDAQAEYAYVVRPGTEVFLPASLVEQGYLPVNDFSVPPFSNTALKRDAAPGFYTAPRNHECLEMSVCRGYTPKQFRMEARFDLDRRHPFVRQCGRWATSDERSVAVLTQVTCESFPGNVAHLDDARSETDPLNLLSARLSDHQRLQLIQYRLEKYHRETQNRFRVTAGTPDRLGTDLPTAAATCARHGAAVEGSLRPARRYECNFQPYQLQWRDGIVGRRLQIDTQVDFFTYLYETGRISSDAKTGPACAQAILRKYHNAVLREEYGLQDAYGIQRAFCVDAVTPVTTRAVDGGNQCEFEVQTQDFLRMPVKLKIAFGNDGSDITAARGRCQELASCFQHDSLKCANANFCPAPGTVSRSIE